MKPLVMEESLRQQTTRCHRQMACLTGECPGCQVTGLINGIVFVKQQRSHCCYRIPFGFESICTCPIRKELYNRYEKSRRTIVYSSPVFG